MADYDQRLALNYRFGSLDGSLAATDTVASSASFADLPILSAQSYLPIIIADPVTSVYEIAWAVGHEVGATTVTLLRAAEQSTAMAWPSGSVWMHGPTARDGRATGTISPLSTPALPHAGMETLFTDVNRVKKYFPDQGWWPYAGGSTKGRALSSGVVGPDHGSPLIIPFSIQQTTDFNGNMGWTSPVFPPNNTIGVWASGLYEGSDVIFPGAVAMYVRTVNEAAPDNGASGLLRAFWPNGDPAANRLINVSMLVIGY